MTKKDEPTIGEWLGADEPETVALPVEEVTIAEGYEDPTMLDKTPVEVAAERYAATQRQVTNLEAEHAHAERVLETVAAALIDARTRLAQARLAVQASMGGDQ